MKKQIILPILLTYFILTAVQVTIAQNDCVDCSGCHASGNHASAIGTNNTASGNNSFAGGYNSRAAGSNSFAFGYNSKALQSTSIALGNGTEATYANSFAIGSYVLSHAQNSITIGYGPTASSPLINSTPYSIALGTYSNHPTLLITKSTNKNYTGKVIVGYASTARAKLYVTADDNEDADLFLEPKNKISHKAVLKLFDENHTLSASISGELKLTATDARLTMMNSGYDFGLNGEKMVHLYSGLNPAIMVNAKRVSGQERRDASGPSFALDFKDNGLCLRTALPQDPRETAITNWKETFRMDLQANTLRFDGHVGINTPNVSGTYALAVDGGIISTKIHIKEAKEWPDYVFSDDYALMNLNELNEYIRSNKHLPGLPSEKIIEEQGYDLDEMTSKLLEKVEELTRYILLLQEEIDELKQPKQPHGDSIIQFNYDANGNRISRSLLITRMNEGSQPTAQQLSGIIYDIFPNPTDGTFSLHIGEGLEQQWQALLFSPSGILLEKQDISTGSHNFNLSDKACGTYLLQLTNGEEQQTWKVVKY